MKKKLLITFTVLCMLALGLAAADLTGAWSGTIITPEGTDFPVNFDFKVDADKLTGTATGGGSSLPLENGKFSKDSLWFKLADPSGNEIMCKGKYYSQGDSVSLNVNQSGALMHTTLKRGGK